MNHGGVMPNYECNAACRHCLYACSPTRTGGYMGEAVMHEMFGILRENGCRSVHIGGGEPFLDFEGLLVLVGTAARYGIGIDYIETNASWVGDEAITKKRLKELSNAGADTLCISVDPFHVEYVPLKQPLRLAKVCAETGFGYFLWQERFLSMMQGLDPEICHSRASLEAAIGKDYIYETARAYGLCIGGRAVNIEREFSVPRHIEITTKPCSGLLSGNHFHVDMHNRYIPPGCTGIAIELRDAAEGLPPGKYPALEALLEKGLGGLYEYAVVPGAKNPLPSESVLTGAGNPEENLGFAKKFVPDETGYTSPCAMCFHIRKHLSGLGRCPELVREHYEESLRIINTSDKCHGLIISPCQCIKPPKS